MKQHNAFCIRTTLNVVGLFFVIVTLTGCHSMTTRKERPTQRTLVRQDLKSICEEHDILWKWDSVSQVVSLRHQKETAEFIIGSPMVLMGSEEIFLSKPTELVQSRIIVPLDFKNKVIERLLEGQPISEGDRMTKVRMLIIDPGHGGKDPGALGAFGSYEKQIVMDISGRLAKILMKNNIKVRMTRTKDEFISLQKRTEMASSGEIDLFLSIHANANTVRAAHGIEFYTLKNLTKKERQEAQRKINLHQYLKDRKGRWDNKALNKTLEDMLYTSKQQQALKLAKAFDKTVSKKVGLKNRGLKTARFYVLRNTVVPAILVEVGFLTNPKEERLLVKSSYRQKMAESLATNVIEYIHGQ